MYTKAAEVGMQKQPKYVYSISRSMYAKTAEECMLKQSKYICFELPKYAGFFESRKWLHVCLDLCSILTQYAKTQF